VLRIGDKNTYRLVFREDGYVDVFGS
jgi:hypothetical protein